MDQISSGSGPPSIEILRRDILFCVDEEEGSHPLVEYSNALSHHLSYRHKHGTRDGMAVCEKLFECRR